MSIKMYRSSNPSIEYTTVSLRLGKNVMRKLEKAVSHTDHKNMSATIENIVCDKDVVVIEGQRKRSREVNTEKKTFTFTKEFYNRIKKTGNMSLYIDTILNETL